MTIFLCAHLELHDAHWLVNHNGYRTANRLENFRKRSRPSNLSHSATFTPGAAAVVLDNSECPAAVASETPAWSSFVGPCPFDVQREVIQLVQAI